MNVLAIGNSFSEDAMRHLHEISVLEGKSINTANLYIGGCSLETHYENMVSNKKVYELQYNGENTGFYVSLNEALTNREWDIVTLQQVSHQSFNTESYSPYIDNLAEYIRARLPRAKLFLHQTWSYEDGSDRLISLAGYNKSEHMLRDIIEANLAVAKRIGADGIIRSGELFGVLLEKGATNLHRDTFHASLDFGRYALGLLWYHVLSSEQISDNILKKFGEIIAQDDIKLAIKLINEDF